MLKTRILWQFNNHHNMVFACLILTLTLSFYRIQPVLAVNPTDQSISSIRLEALKAQNDNDLDRAEALYDKALSEAENSGSSMKVIEFLSRIVQIKIRNHKLGQTDALVQRAIKLALTIKTTSASDSNLEVWMDDMANAFYSRGEHSAREDVKEYCLKQYIDIELSTKDHYEPLLAGRAGLLTEYLNHNGRYLEQFPYDEKLFNYVQRTKSNDPFIMAAAYGGLGNACLLTHKPAAAEFAFKQCFLQRSKFGKNLGDEAELNFNLGHVKEEEGDLQAARTFYQKALEQEKECLRKPAVSIGIYESILGFFEQRVGNLTEAAKLFKASLACFDKCPIPEVTSANAILHPEGLLYSGQVFSSEHLAQIELKQGNPALAHSLQSRANKIRAQNPHWAACKHPDPNSFYALEGHFPFAVEAIPTRTSYTLQEISPK